MGKAHDITEVAIFEIRIGDQWVEWNRLQRHLNEQWDEGVLLLMNPRKRVRFVSSDGYEHTRE